MRNRTLWISAAVLAVFVLATGGSIAFVALPQRAVEEAVRQKLRSEHTLVRDLQRVAARLVRRVCRPDRQDVVPEFQPFHAAKSSDGRWTVTFRPEAVRKKCG